MSIKIKPHFIIFVPKMKKRTLKIYISKKNDFTVSHDD